MKNKNEKIEAKIAAEGDLTPEERQWLVNRYGIKPEEIVRHHSGACYDRIIVTNIEAADKVSAAVAGAYVDGGWFHGMELGRITPDGKGNFDVMC